MSSFDQLTEAEQIARYKKLARKALAAYGLEEAELHLLGQSHNVVFRVQADDGRWALRICSPGIDRARLLRELLWLTALCRDTNLAVPEPVLMRSGDLLHSVSMQGLSGFRACVLFRWVKGQFVDEWTPKHVRSIGEFTATLHRHGSIFRWPEEPPLMQISPTEIASNLSRERLRTRYPESEVELLQDTIPAISSVLESLGSGSDVVGVVHGDLRRGNVLFQGETAGAIDFECARRHYYAYDVAATLCPLMGKSEYLELRSAYVEGYERVFELPCNLDRHLAAFDMLRALTTIERVLETPHSQPDARTQSVLDGAVRKAQRLLDPK